ERAAGEVRRLVSVRLALSARRLVEAFIGPAEGVPVPTLICTNKMQVYSLACYANQARGGCSPRTRPSPASSSKNQGLTQNPAISTTHSQRLEQSSSPEPVTPAEDKGGELRSRVDWQNNKQIITRPLQSARVIFVALLREIAFDLPGTSASPLGRPRIPVKELKPEPPVSSSPGPWNQELNDTKKPRGERIRRQKGERQPLVRDRSGTGSMCALAGTPRG
ncbi:unnamed protein product, partial [Pleuronectes platessa]